jgi:3-dehydroquinate synthetase/shikimate kinase
MLPSSSPSNPSAAVAMAVAQALNTNARQSICLTGFMGSGKSTLGRKLAQVLGFRFVDTDQEIERQSGLSVAAFFAQHGEAAFREKEAEVLAQCLLRPRTVVATGGGTLANEANLQQALAHSVVCYLAMPVEELFERVIFSPKERPLVDVPNAKEAFMERFAAREPFYTQAPVQVATLGLKPYEATEALLHQLAGHLGVKDTPLPTRTLPQWSPTLQVRSQQPQRWAYPIYSGPHLLPNVGQLLQQERVLPAGGQVLVVSDDTVAPLYLPTVLQSLEAAGFKAHSHVLPAGEATKTLAQLEALYTTAYQHQLKRNDVCLALGGGVVGDITGLLAATFNRGCGFVQVPTTLLAQVDSSVGGKVAVNFGQAKNSIGAFYQPKLVVACGGVLGSLPPREALAGFAEVLKCGLLEHTALRGQLRGQKPLWALLQQAEPASYLAQAPLWVQRSCAIKAAVVGRDERETLPSHDPMGRISLNLGHTFAHAYEAHLGYDGRLLHGEAVALGLYHATLLAEALGLLQAASVAQVRHVLERMGYLALLAQPALAPLKELAELPRLLALMGHDKKVEQAGVVRFVLPTEQPTTALGSITVRSLGVAELHTLLQPVAAHLAGG